MFTVLCCAEVCGTKVNLEIGFPALPTIGEFRRRAEEAFNAEQRLLSPVQLSGAPAQRFRISRMQIYDDVLLKWVDLISSTQLHEYDQVYCFHPAAPWQESQTDLPAPRQPCSSGGAPSDAAAFAAAPPLQGAAPGAATAGGGPGAAAGLAPAPEATAVLPCGWAPSSALEEKAQQVFCEMDTNGRGFLEFADVDLGLRQRGLDFSRNTVGELFYKADLDGDGRVTLGEWVNWAAVYPNTLESLWFHSRDCVAEQEVRRRLCQIEGDLRNNSLRREQLMRQLAALDASDEDLRRQQQQALADSRGAECRRVRLSQHEKDLIEEEIKMERQRDQMRLQHSRFQEVSERFNRDCLDKGSPRRAMDAGW
eukprot:TRINITY_DN50916_c0_g1_i1.p1 TRINITY_DN50916_c0_g1~~TRINITY_DN50916_c0_g1_i1.p1  ORF type:complete len:396 (+),score=158.06 TRINITY_DN50916_c0_g1_i1:91-1188(+)